MKSRQSLQIDRGKTGGGFFRWILTIIIILAVLGFEVYLFSRYSLWFKKANAQAENTGNGNATDYQKVPIQKVPQDKDSNMVIPSPPMREFHPSPPPPSGSGPGQKSQRETATPPPIATSKPIPGMTSALPPPPEGSRDVVNPAALKLMEKAPSMVFLRGVIELESRDNYFLAPGREREILEICINIKKNWKNKDVRNKFLNEARYAFFAGLNEKQMKFVEGNMREWDKNLGDYKADDGEDQIEFMLDECIRILSQKVDKNPAE